MYPPMSIEEFARRLEEPIERLREWRTAGILGVPEPPGKYHRHGGKYQHDNNNG